MNTPSVMNKLSDPQFKEFWKITLSVVAGALIGGLVVNAHHAGPGRQTTEDQLRTEAMAEVDGKEIEISWFDMAMALMENERRGRPIDPNQREYATQLALYKRIHGENAVKDLYRNTRPSTESVQILQENLTAAGIIKQGDGRLAEYAGFQQAVYETLTRTAREAKLRGRYIREESPAGNVQWRDSAVLHRESPEEASPVHMQVFTNYKCGYCKAFDPLWEVYANRYPALRVEIRHFPGTAGQEKVSRKAAEAAWCAGEQDKLPGFHKALFEATSLEEKDLREVAKAQKLHMGDYDACVESPEAREAVRQDESTGRRLGVNRTPFVAILGRPVHEMTAIYALDTEIRRAIEESSKN